MKLWSSVLILGLLAGTSSIGMTSDADDSDIGGDEKVVRQRLHEARVSAGIAFDGREVRKKRRLGAPLFHETLKPKTPVVKAIVGANDDSRSRVETSQPYVKEGHRPKQLPQGPSVAPKGEKNRTPVVLATAPRPTSTSKDVDAAKYVQGPSFVPGGFAGYRPSPFSGGNFTYF